MEAFIWKKQGTKFFKNYKNTDNIMATGFFRVPVAKNEPVYSYAPGTLERAELQKAISEMRATEADLPMIIGGKK